MTVVVLIFIFLILFQTARTNREMETLHQKEAFSQNYALLEGYPDDINQIASRVSGSGQLISYFVPLAHDGDQKNYFSDNLIDSINAGSLLSDILGISSGIARISVFNTNGDYISVGNIYETPDRISAALQDTEQIEQILAELEADEDHCIVRGIHSDTWSDNPDAHLISFYRRLAFTDNSPAYGVVEVQTEVEELAKLNIWNSDEYMIVSGNDKDHSVIYPQNIVLDEESIAAIQALSEGIPDETLETNQTVLMAKPILYTDWLFIRLLPKKALISPYMTTYYLMAGISFLFLLLLIFIIYQITAKITRPLQALVNSIESVNFNDMSPKKFTSHDYTSSEFQKIDSAFSEMLERLNVSVSAEMDGYMRALQSQMNPHFLYNMLTIIIESCDESGADTASHMCIQLTSMLRYITDPTNEPVTFADELEHTKNYLDLMKDRYEDSFSYSIEADESVLNRKVPRLVVQPLTENCFKHAFQGKRPPWKIDISLKAAAHGQWQLTVTDNGIGMDQAKVNEIRQRVADSAKDVAGNYDSLKIGGMALVNSLLRLTLQSKGLSYKIETNKPCGTRIVVEGS